MTNGEMLKRLQDELNAVMEQRAKKEGRDPAADKFSSVLLGAGKDLLETYKKKIAGIEDEEAMSEEECEQQKIKAAEKAGEIFCRAFTEVIKECTKAD